MLQEEQGKHKPMESILRGLYSDYDWSTDPDVGPMIAKAVENGVQRAVERAVEKVVEKAVAERERGVALRMLEARFGQTSEPIASRLATMSNLEIENLMLRVASGATLDELLQ